MADLTGWWDDYFWGAMTVLKVFGVSLILAVIFGLIGASAKLSKSRLIVGSYATETFRGAFMGVDPGVVEASRALGISNLHTFFYVRIPQMWRLALPAFGNHMLSIMKDTALISIIGLEEILFVAEMATAVTLKPFTMYMVVAFIYLSITTVITLVVMLLEKHANRHLEIV